MNPSNIQNQHPDSDSKSSICFVKDQLGSELESFESPRKVESKKRNRANVFDVEHEKQMEENVNFFADDIDGIFKKIPLKRSKKTRGKKKDWQILEHIEKADLLQHLADYQIKNNVELKLEKTVTYKTAKENKVVDQKIYKCAHKECDFRISYEETINIYSVKIDGQHNHENTAEDRGSKKVQGINKLIKIKVDELIQAGVSNFKILEVLKKEEVKDLPTERQLSARRYYLKNTILKDLKNNTKRGFNNWVEENQKQGTEDHDFIIIKYVLEKNNFILLVSTRGLLKNAKNHAEITKQAFVATDATHKLIACKFIFSTFITITKNHETADICYMIHSNEDAETYSYGLNEINNALKTQYEFDWSPKFGMSDFSGSIAKAFKTTFPHILHAKCFFHLVQNVLKKFRKHSALLKPYLYELEKCICEPQLDQLWELIKQDIKDSEIPSETGKEFIDYFESYILHRLFTSWVWKYK